MGSSPPTRSSSVPSILATGVRLWAVQPAADLFEVYVLSEKTALDEASAELLAEALKRMVGFRNPVPPVQQSRSACSIFLVHHHPAGIGGTEIFCIDRMEGAIGAHLTHDSAPFFNFLLRESLF